MTAVEIKRQVKTQEWASKVRACRSSGLSVRAWCQENGVSSTTYYKWENILLAAIQREDVSVNSFGGRSKGYPATDHHPRSRVFGDYPENCVNLRSGVE